MKLLMSALMLGFVIAAVPQAEAAGCAYHHGCHKVIVVHHIHHHYHHYVGGVVVPPPGYPPPYGYSTFDQPLAGAGILIGDPYWGNRGTLQLLFNSIGDRPYAE